MRKTKIITDSASDIPKSKAEELDIRVLPFTIIVDGKEYSERVDFTDEEFYEIMENCIQIPSTAQITQFKFAEVFEEYYSRGYSDIIYVSINSKGSNTYQSAIMAKTEFYENHPGAVDSFNIYVIDSLTYTIAYGHPVMEAAVKASRGVPANEIATYLEDFFSNTELFFVTYSLKYAKKSARISAAALFMGELIGIRPILAFIKGESVILEKIRGENKLIPALLDIAAKKMVPQTQYSVVYGSARDKGDELIKEAEKRFGYKPTHVVRLGAAIAINSGPEVIGLFVKTRGE